MPLRRALAVLAALGGLLAAFAGSPYRAQHATLDVERAAAAIAREEDHITAVELAEWIHDRKPELRIIDLRTAKEFDDYHLPRSERVPIEALFGSARGGPARLGPTASLRPGETIVLISDGGAHAAQAWVLLQALGFRHVYFLRGGLGEWLDDVMNPTIAADASPQAIAEFQRVSALSRYFGGVPRVIDKGAEASQRRASGDRVLRETPSSESGTTPAVDVIRRRGC
ncbi:MAG TPA: rhodanese-like domain-containing protein [Thermoanaerobaculia bacterium]|nr:rhodanese-like domain-containing protein [Thermoanaerobaculia bacterium]